MKFLKRIVNWFLGRDDTISGFCFNCGKQLDKNYASLFYTHEEGETEYGRLCVDCANILDNLEQTKPVEVDDYEETGS